jgi:glyoxylase-like metal-dependent hydrolase (beta-lactamase superfamily II)
MSSFLIEPFFDPATFTLSYVVYEQAGSACAIIDSVLDYDHKSGRTHTASADRIVAFVRAQQLTVEWILETHIHADHLSGAPYLRAQLGGKIAVGEHVKEVQDVFKKVFNLERDFHTDGSQFDHLFQANEHFNIGNLPAQAWHVPGHTPADMAFLVGDAIFVGDTIFMPDVGSARCDFPNGNARTLYQSVQRILSLPAETRIFICHDYPPASREMRFQTSVAEQRADSIHFHDDTSEDDFVALRNARDANLPMPVLILPSVQVNVRAGELPPAEDNGVRYLKVPLNAL